MTAVILGSKIEKTKNGRRILSEAAWTIGKWVEREGEVGESGREEEEEGERIERLKLSVSKKH